MDADTGETITETSTISKDESEKPVTENKSRSVLFSRCLMLAYYYRCIVVINLHVEIRQGLPLICYLNRGKLDLLIFISFLCLLVYFYVKLSSRGQIEKCKKTTV